MLVYLGARETPVFAVRTIDVRGRPRRGSRGASRPRSSPLEGKSLLKVRRGEVARLATALPVVAGVSYDRAFPNTLRVRVEPEQPVAVVRRGVEAWLVSRRGRVMARIPQRTHRTLPRIWLRQPVDALSSARRSRPGGGADEVGAARRAARQRASRGAIASVHEVEGSGSTCFAAASSCASAPARTSR